VPYAVNTVEAVVEYLRDKSGLSPDGLRAVTEGYLRELGDDADKFLAKNPLGHESYLFEYDFVLFDGGRLYEFRFVVSGADRAYGVVHVLYVDHTSTPIPDI
jgi:hypothetical protein